MYHTWPPTHTKKTHTNTRLDWTLIWRSLSLVILILELFMPYTSCMLMHVAYVCPFKTLQKSAIKFLIISNTSVFLLFLMYFSTSPLPKKSNVPKAKRSTPNFSWPHPLPGLIHPIGTSWASNSVSPVKSMHTSTGSQAWTGFKNLWWYLPLIGHNGIHV